MRGCNSTRCGQDIQFRMQYLGIILGQDPRQSKRVYATAYKTRVPRQPRPWMNIMELLVMETGSSWVGLEVVSFRLPHQVPVPGYGADDGLLRGTEGARGGGEARGEQARSPPSRDPLPRG